MENQLRVSLFLFDNSLYKDCYEYIKDIDYSNQDESLRTKFDVIKQLSYTLSTGEELESLLKLKETNLFSSIKDIAINCYSYLIRSNIITINDINFLAKDIYSEVTYRLNFPKPIKHNLRSPTYIRGDNYTANSSLNEIKLLFSSCLRAVKSNLPNALELIQELESKDLSTIEKNMLDGLKIKYSILNTNYSYGFNALESLVSRDIDKIPEEFKAVDVSNIVVEFISYFKNRGLVNDRAFDIAFKYLNGTIYEYNLFFEFATYLKNNNRFNEIYPRSTQIREDLRNILSQSQKDKLDDFINDMSRSNIS